MSIDDVVIGLIGLGALYGFVVVMFWADGKWGPRDRR